MPDDRVMTAAEVWQRYDAMEARLSASLSQRMLDLAHVSAGKRVLDLATGRGDPAVQAAVSVGPTGYVVGLEPNDGVLQMARTKASVAGVSNLDVRGIAAEALDSLGLADVFDAATVRWGLMYFDAPVVALRAVHRALKREGVLVAALWAEPERAPCHAVPWRLLEGYRSLPPVGLDAPGMFRYADPSRIERDFARAGFAIEHMEEADVDVVETATAAELVQWIRDAMPFKRWLNDLPVSDQQAWQDDLMRAAQDFHRQGHFRMGGITRIVVARPRPDQTD